MAYTLWGRLVTGKRVLVIACVFLALMLFVKLWFEPYFTAHANGDYLEMDFFYTPDSLYDRMERYGQTGRALYTKSSIGLDFVLPFQYSLFFSACAAWILQKLGWREAFRKAVFIAGVVLCCSDWLENVFLLIVVNRFPQKMIALSRLANGMTLLKSALTMLFIAAIAAGFAGLLIRRKRG